MRRDYKNEDIFDGDFDAYVKDMIADCPNHNITNILHYMVNDAINDEGKPVLYGHRDSIKSFNTIPDDEIYRFCIKHSDYDAWAFQMTLYLYENKDAPLRAKCFCEPVANTVMTIFDYYRFTILPRYWLKGTLPIPGTINSPSPLNSSSEPVSDPIDSYILYTDKNKFKDSMSLLLQGTKGKQSAIYIYMAINHGFMKRASAPLLQNAFKFGGSLAAFNDYFSKISTTPKQYHVELDDAYAALSQLFDTV